MFTLPCKVSITSRAHGESSKYPVLRSHDVLRPYVASPIPPYTKNAADFMQRTRLLFCGLLSVQSAELKKLNLYVKNISSSPKI